MTMAAHETRGQRGNVRFRAAIENMELRGWLIGWGVVAVRRLPQLAQMINT